MAASPPFRFKKFRVEQEGAAHPVGTDGVLLGAWADVSSAKTILDIGTGTGLVALMLAQRAPECTALGVEIHEPSALCAARNFAASPFAERLSVVCQSVQDFAQSIDYQFDLLACNPPFFSENTISPDETRRLGRHSRSLPLGDLLAAAQKLLAPGGRFCAILPEKTGRLLCEMAATSGLYFTKICAVRARREKPLERLLLEFRREPHEFESSELTIHADGQRYSSAFWELTGEFYL